MVPFRAPKRLLGIIMSAVAIVALSSPVALAQTGHGKPHPRPTIVLIHGAWASSASWAAVVRRLHADGYATANPDLALESLSGDVAAVQQTLDTIHGKKVLVGHSYGGEVISGASAGRADVRALVFSAAFVPDTGDSIASLGTGFQQSEAFAHLAFTGTPFASPAYIAPDLFRSFFAQDLSATRAALLGASQRPLNFPIVTTPSGAVGWHSIRSWYAVSAADRMIDPAEQRWMATRAGATTVEFAHASHVGGITVDANRFARLIETAAKATS